MMKLVYKCTIVWRVYKSKIFLSWDWPVVTVSDKDDSCVQGWTHSCIILNVTYNNAINFVICIKMTELIHFFPFSKATGGVHLSVHLSVHLAVKQVRKGLLVMCCGQSLTLKNVTYNITYYALVHYKTSRSESDWLTSPKQWHVTVCETSFVKRFCGLVRPQVYLLLSDKFGHEWLAHLHPHLPQQAQ